MSDGGTALLVLFGGTALLVLFLFLAGFVAGYGAGPR